MAAEPRYRVEVWATKCLVVDYSRPLNAYRSVLAACWTDGVANMIAAALNAAEDAGRWKAALELVEFKAREGHSHRSLAATARAGLNGHDLRRALATTLSRHEARQALKAEPKEAQT